tara:strand:+ start:62 stop:385 length:324 start_codon:yes stop_codon:yes gene_type:complete
VVVVDVHSASGLESQVDQVVVQREQKPIPQDKQHNQHKTDHLFHKQDLINMVILEELEQLLVHMLLLVVVVLVGQPLLLVLDLVQVVLVVLVNQSLDLNIRLLDCPH